MPTAKINVPEGTYTYTIDGAPGSVTVTAAITAPTSAGSLTDVSITENSGLQNFDVAPDFTGDALTFSLQTATAGLSMSAAGVLAVDTTATGVMASLSVVVIATNTAGSANSAFSLSVTDAGSGVATYIATADDFARDNLVFDSGFLRGANKTDRDSAAIALTGALTDDVGAPISEAVTIQARALLVDSGGETAWQPVGTAASGAPTWSGTMTLPRSPSTYQIQTRVAGSSQITTMTTTCAVGHVLVLIGQSEHQRIGDVGQQTSMDSNLTYPSIATNGRVRVAWRPNDETAATEFTTVSDATPHSPAVAALANALIEMRPDDHMTVIFETKGATNLQQLTNDSVLERSFSEDLDIINAGSGNQITGFGAVLLDWTAGPGRWGSDYDEVFGQFFTKERPDGMPMIAGDIYDNDAGAGPVTFDHYWADLDDGVPVLPYGPHRFETVSTTSGGSTPITFKNAEQNGDGSVNGPMMLKRMTRQGMHELQAYDPDRFWPKGASPLLYRNGDAGSNTPWVDIAHPGKLDNNQGLPLWAQQNAYVVGQMMGWQSWTPPEITAADVTWATNGSSVDIAIAQPLSTVELDEGGANTSVAGFEVSGRAASADILNGTIRVTHPDGAFSINDTVRFGMGGASGVITYPDDIEDEIWKQWPMVAMNFTAAYDAAGNTNPGIALEPVIDFDVFANTLPLPGGATTVDAIDTAFADRSHLDSITTKWSGVTDKVTLQVKFTPVQDFGAATYQNIISYGSLDPVSLSIHAASGLVRVRARDTDDIGIIDTATHTVTLGEETTLTLAVDVSDPSNGKIWLRSADNTLLWSATGVVTNGMLSKAVFKLFDGEYTGSFEHAIFWTDCTADGSAPTLASAYRVIAGAADLVNAHDWKLGSDVTNEGGTVVGSGVQNIVLLGQSEPHRLLLANHADLGNAEAVVDEGALEIWWYDLDTSSPNNATGVQRDAITNANKVSRWAVEMSNALAASAPGQQFKVCMLLFAGTGLDDLLDEGQTAGGRYWTRNAPFNGDADVYAQFVTETGITQPDAAFMSWQNTDSTQIQYQIADAWWTALTGTALDDGSPVAAGAMRHNVTYDHFLNELWDTDTVPFTFLMHRYDVFSGSDIDWNRFRDVRVSFDRMVSSARNQARAVPFLRGVDPNAYENGYDVGDDSHPRKTDDGATKYAQQLAYNMARMTGTPLVAPKIDTVTWAENTVALGSNDGDLTTTRIIRSETLPVGQPKVAQLYFRAAGQPLILHEVPDAALSMTAGDIVIDAAELLSSISAGRTVFIRGDRLEFASGPAGANDVQDKTNDTWLDYPGIADSVNEITPLQPVSGVIVCDLGTPAAVTNLLRDFATWAAAQGAMDQGDGWFPTNLNARFDSNVSADFDAGGLTGGIENATVVVDLDREIGGDAQSSTQISLRDNNGVGHQRLRVANFWGDVNVDSPQTSVTTFGWMPLPGGRVRLWGYFDSTTGGRHILYLNNSNTGGACGFAGVFDGQLSIEDIAGI